MLLCCGVRSNFEGVVVCVSVQTYDGVGHFDCKKNIIYKSSSGCLEVSCCCAAVIVIDRHHPTARLMPIRFIDHPLQSSFHLPSFTDNSEKCRLWGTFLAFLASSSTDVKEERQRWNRCVARSFKFVLLMRFWCSGTALFLIEPQRWVIIIADRSTIFLENFSRASALFVVRLWVVVVVFWFFFWLRGFRGLNQLKKLYSRV